MEDGADTLRVVLNLVSPVGQPVEAVGVGGHLVGQGLGTPQQGLEMRAAGRGRGGVCIRHEAVKGVALLRSHRCYLLGGEWIKLR